MIEIKVGSGLRQKRSPKRKGQRRRSDQRVSKVIPIPVEDCQLEGRAGFRYGPTGHCYTHNGSEEGKKAAHAQAAKQGRAVEWSKHSNSYPSEHAVRVRDPGDFEEGSFRSKELPKSEGGKGGVRIILGHLKGESTMTVQAYHFPADLYDVSEVHSWLKKNDITHWLKIEPAKQENASGELSYEYLRAIYDQVMAHPGIWDKIKGDVHLTARASAGGQIKAKRAAEGLEDVLSISDEPIKFTNAAPLDAYLSETDEYIDTSVVLAKEGVFRGTDDEPRLKPFDALKASAQWMLGTPITNGHIPGEVLPDTRRIGQIIDVKARPETRDIFGTARFFKNYLTEDELKRLREGSPIDGSIGYRTPIKYDSGNFNGEDYVGIETGPFVLDEYAILPGSKGACSSAMGCGIFQNSAVVESDDMLVLIDGDVKKCPRKNKNQSGDIENMTPEEFKPLLIEAIGPAIKEAMGGITTRLDALEKKADSAPVSIPITDVPEFKALADSVKTLNESFQKKTTAEDAAKEAANKGEFVKMLNAGSLADADKLYGEVKGLNPVEYEAWKKANTGKLLNEAEKKDLKGQKHANSGGDEVTTARAKALETLHKRR